MLNARMIGQFRQILSNMSQRDVCYLEMPVPSQLEYIHTKEMNKFLKVDLNQCYHYEIVRLSFVSIQIQRILNKYL
jgi:hypothetical protein